MPLTGKNVEVDYVSVEGTGETTFMARFERKGNAGAMSTRVKPHTGLVPDGTGWRLKHGPSSATDHIRELRVSGGGKPSSCTFEYERDLRIVICSEDNKDPCTK